MAGNVVDERCCCDNERPIAILSIDGGGVRGIIPGKILEFVEKQLQLLHGPDAKIYEYFDMICGTSTGGLIAAMLATPKPNSDEPIIDAKDICQFYIDEAPKIFSNKGDIGVKDDEDKEDDQSVYPRLLKPIYDGKYLLKLIREKVGERKVEETVTNVPITSFDDVDDVNDDDNEIVVHPCIDGLGRSTLLKPIYDGKYLLKLIREKVGERKVEETVTNVPITSFDDVNDVNDVNDDDTDNEIVYPRFDGPGRSPLFRPIYNGKYLRKLIREKVGKRKVAETLTNVLITSFDIKVMKPSIFSTIRAKDKEIENVLMSDVGISTSAAPVFFPPYYFENTVEGKKYEFNLADGGLAANNPTLLGIGEMAPKVRNQEDKFLVLSLGTGEIADEHVQVRGRRWGIFDWFFAFGKKIWHNPSYPLLDAFSNASDSMVDIYTAMYLQDNISKDNFLRVQVCDQAALDNAKPENLKNLVKLGEDLLNQHIVSVDLPTGHYIETDKTYRDALIEFVKRLSKIPRPSLEKM